MMKRRYFLLTGLLCFLSFQVNAQTAPSGHLLPLWTAKGKSNTVHFLGSIHFLKRDFYPLAAPIENAYSNSPIVVFETEMGRMNEPEAMKKILADGLYPPGKTIQSDLSKQTYQLLQKTAREKVGVANAFDTMKPHIAAVGLLTLELQRLGFGGKDGVDQYFFNKAQTDKKDIRHLETLEEQMGLFNKLTKSESEEFLISSLKDMDQFEKIFTEMVDAWKVGDTKKLDELVLDSMKDYPDLVERFLSERNRKWMGEIEKLLQGSKDAFVVVGAAHLVGKDNVIELLKTKGFKAEQRKAE